MGLVKAAMLEAEERGWHEPDGFVCPDCVDDEYLKDLIRAHVSQRNCDYCGQRTRSKSAAPVAVIMEPIAGALRYHFEEPAQAGVPWEKGWVFEPTDTEDALMALPLHCHEQLFDDIVQSFTDTAWVPASRGHWLGEHPHEELSALWASFVHMIKHEVRFFFQSSAEHKPTSSWYPDPRNILHRIGDLTKEISLVRQVPAGVTLFRVRARDEGAAWEPDAEQLGAPPPGLARAGRMNPAGISYLYLAFEHATALAEVLQSPPCSAAIAEFATQRVLNVLDLANLPNWPSVFGENRRDEREAFLFLDRFVEAISEPVRKDGGEHIGYVPSQVVSEYFELVFRHGRGKRLDGILYPSAVRPGGRNLVLFPSERGYKRDFDQVVFQAAWEQAFADWAEFAAALNT